MRFLDHNQEAQCDRFLNPVTTPAYFKEKIKKWFIFLYPISHRVAKELGHRENVIHSSSIFTT